MVSRHHYPASLKVGTMFNFELFFRVGLFLLEGTRKLLKDASVTREFKASSKSVSQVSKNRKIGIAASATKVS